MPKQNRKHNPSAQPKRPKEVSRIYVVPKKDYNYILRSGKGEENCFHFDGNEDVEYVQVRVDGGKLAGLVTLEMYEAHTSALLRRPGKDLSFRTVQRVKKKNNKQEKIVYQGISSNEKETIRKLDEEYAKAEARWENPKPFLVSSKTPVCILASSDVRRYFQHVAKLKGKEVQVHSARHSIALKNQEMAELRGFVVRGKNFFAVSAQVFLGVGEVELKQDFPINPGTLSGMFGVSMRIIINTHTNAVYELLKNEEKRLEERGQNKKEGPGKAPEKFAPPKPSSTIVQNHQTWHSPLNLSFDLSGDKKIQLYSQKCHCSKCSGRLLYDPVIDCTAKVSTKSGQTVPVTVQYCTGCGSFFMNYATYKSYDKKYGGLKFRCRVEAGDLAKMDKDSSFADDSFLSRNGYNVNASTPRSQRQAALARILDRGIASKYEVTEKISEFINLRKNNPHMADAIDRWEEDIAFVAGYKIREQADVGKREFEQKGKITKGRR